MKPAILILTGLLLAPLGALCAADTNQPNIIVIITDDHGWADLCGQGVDARRAHVEGKKTAGKIPWPSGLANGSAPNIFKRMNLPTTASHPPQCPLRNWRPPALRLLWRGLADNGGWRHWSRSSTMTPENFTIDMWPDLTEFDPATLARAGDVTTGGGEPAYLFSSRNYAAVQKHYFKAQGVFVIGDLPTTWKTRAAPSSPCASR